MAGARPRVSTGVPGLDGLIEGGLLPGRTYVVSGPPGSGKTTFGVQFLAAGAWQGERGMYVSLLEDVENIVYDMTTFSFKIEELVSSGKLLFMDLGEMLQASAEFPTYKQLLTKVTDQVKFRRIQRLVIDSISAIKFIGSDPKFEKKQMGEFFRGLQKIGCTTLLLSEMTDPERYLPEHFLAHGVIFLHNFLSDSRMVRAIQIIKMRGTRHDCNLRRLEITKNGLRVTSMLKSI
ncbi:MAG: ATPase [Euryarchaeota archaeon]|nr:ATPase [Euryarchaeota archaeon]